MQEREHVDGKLYMVNLRELESLAPLLRSAIDRIPPNQREAKIWGKWSPKDVVAHFGAWAKLTLDGITEAKAKNKEGRKDTEWKIIPLFLTDDELEKFNLNETSDRDTWSWDEVYSEYVETEQELLMAYQSLSLEDPNDMLVEFVTFCIEGDVEHYQEHIDSLESILLSSTS